MDFAMRLRRQRRETRPFGGGEQNRVIAIRVENIVRHGRPASKKKKKKKFRVPRCWLEPQLTALSPFLFLRHPVFIGNPPSSSKERTRERSK